MEWFYMYIDNNECLTADICGTDSTCINTMGSYFCLPVFDNTALSINYDPLLGMDGGEVGRVEIAFEPGTVFDGLNTTIDQQYRLTQLQYGPVSRELLFTPPLDSVGLTYDQPTGVLVIDFNTTIGLFLTLSEASCLLYNPYHFPLSISLYRNKMYVRRIFTHVFL